MNQNQIIIIIIIHGTHSRGGKRNSLQEKKPVCVSPRDGPRRTGPPGSGQPTPTLCTNHFLCLGLLSTTSRLAQSRPFCHANVGYRRCFHHSTEIYLHFSFLSSPFELESTPHLHFAVIFRVCRFDSVQWVQIKVASLDLLRFLKGKTLDIVFNVRISAVSK